MSKASEWARIRVKGERGPALVVGCTRLSIKLPTKRKGPRLKMTGWAARPMIIEVRTALRAARWILDTFEDQGAPHAR